MSESIKYNSSGFSVYLLILIVKFSLDSYLVSTASKLRLIADDYCNAGIVSKFGILGASNFYYMNWNGFFTTNFLTTFYFGIINNKDPYLFSLVALVLIEILTWIIFIIILREFTSKRIRILFSGLLSSIFIIILISNGFGTVAGGFIYFIGWVTVAIGWTIPSLLSVIYLLIIINLDLSVDRKFKILYVSTFVFILGGTNLQIGMITLLSLLFLVGRILLKSYGTKIMDRDRLYLMLIQIITLCISVFIALLSPGGRHRSTIIAGNLQDFSLTKLLQFTISDILYSIDQLNFIKITQIIMIGIFLGGVIRSLNLKNSKLVSNKVKGFDPLNLLIYLITILMINTLLNFFSYAAKWHLIPLYISVILFLFMTSLIFGYTFFEKSRSYAVFISLIAVIPTCLYVIQMQNARNLIEIREQDWSIGKPVPYDEIGDIEIADGWISRCRAEISQLEVNKRLI